MPANPTVASPKGSSRDPRDRRDNAAVGVRVVTPFPPGRSGLVRRPATRCEGRRPSVVTVRAGIRPVSDTAAFLHYPRAFGERIRERECLAELVNGLGRTGGRLGS